MFIMENQKIQTVTANCVSMPVSSCVFKLQVASNIDLCPTFTLLCSVSSFDLLNQFLIVGYVPGFLFCVIVY